MGFVRSSAASDTATAHDIGTLWMLERGESTARCALLSVGAGLELRVLMDGSPLRAERCDSHTQAFELAARWRDRMVDRGWTKVVPGVPVRPARRREAV